MKRWLLERDFTYLAGAMKGVQRRAMCGLGVTKAGQHLLNIWAQPHIGAAFEHSNRLVGVCGAVIVHPGTASTFMYATNEMPKIIIELSRYILREMFPTLKGLGCHRVQALALADDEAGDRWKRDILGCTLEATFRGYGVNREDYVLHVKHLD